MVRPLVTFFFPEVFFTHSVLNLYLKKIRPAPLKLEWSIFYLPRFTLLKKKEIFPRIGEMAKYMTLDNQQIRSATFFLNHICSKPGRGEHCAMKGHTKAVVGKRMNKRKLWKIVCTNNKVHPGCCRSM